MSSDEAVRSEQNEFQYVGWSVRWTGWKMEKLTLGSAPEQWCGVCGNRVNEGDAITADSMVYTGVPVHWTCKHPDNPPGKLYAQWTACLGENSNFRFRIYLYAMCSPVDPASLPGKYFKPGDMLEFPDDFVHVTESDDDSVKASARAAGRLRILQLIDVANIDRAMVPCEW